MVWPKKTLTHKRVSRTTDGQGGWTNAPSTLTTSLKASVQPASATEVEMAGPNFGYISHTVYLDPSASIERDDTFITSDSRTLRVKSVQNSTKTKYVKCLCEEVQAGN